MLKEEKELRGWASSIDPDYDDPKVFLKDVTALVKAVREDCAKVADDWDYNHGSEQQPWAYGSRIAAAIRGKK